MVVRARLAVPEPLPREDWPYHKVQWTSIPTRLLTVGDRRMEGETYLSHGYGIRLAIEARPKGWVKFSQLARVSLPPRTKATLVSPEYGKPFLAATQVFDIRPFPRKWLAVEKISHAKALFVEAGDILVTRSGAVGRAIVAFEPHLETIISDDLLRVEAREEKCWGWLYAYLRAQKARAMMTGTRYGHIIKHLETGHLNALPIPTMRDVVLEDFNERAHSILELRNKSYQATLDAEAHFEKCLGPLNAADSGESGFAVPSSAEMFGGNRRLDASRHNPVAVALRRHLANKGRAVQLLAQCGYSVWVPGRYKRIPAEDGVVFVDSSDLFEINPDTTKRYADCKFGDNYRGRVEPGWLLMASSGQTYGLVGGVVLATAFLEGKVVANHVIRLAPRSDCKVRPGYVLTALSHPTLGRPLVKSLTFGSSVPEISPDDVRGFGLVRLADDDEGRIAELAEKSANFRAKADILENEIASEAEEILNRFITGDMTHVDV